MAGIDSDLIRGHIDTIILNILAEGDRYGYEICKEVENKSKGSYELKQPTLYSCLKRLESQRLISSYWEDSDIGGGGGRHYYKLTDEGRDTFKQSQDDWRRSREIIDNLISGADQSNHNLESDGDIVTVNTNTDGVNENEADNTATYDDDDAAAVNTNSDEDYIDPATDNTMIFDEIDKEVAEQDSGFIPNDTEPKYINSQPDPAQENGFETEDSTILPFDETDLSAYCSHLVRNGDLQAKEENNAAINDETEKQDDLISYAKAATADSDEDTECVANNTSDTENIEDNCNDTESTTEDSATEDVNTTEDDDIMALLGHTPSAFSTRANDAHDDVSAAEKEEADNDAGVTDLTENNTNTTTTTAQNEGLAASNDASVAQDNKDSDIKTQASDMPNAEEVSTSQEGQFLAKFITGKYSEYNPDREELAAELAGTPDTKAQNQDAQTGDTMGEDNTSTGQFVTSDVAEFNDDDEFSDSDEETSNVESFFDATETSVPQTDANNLTDLHLDNDVTTNAASGYTLDNDTNKPYSTLNSGENGERVNNEDVLNEYAADSNTDSGSQPTYNFDQSVYSPLGNTFGENKQADENDFTPRGVMNNFADKYDAPKPTGDDEVLLDFSTPEANSDDEIVMDFSANQDGDANAAFDKARDNRDNNDALEDNENNADDYSNTNAEDSDYNYNNADDYGDGEDHEYSSFMNDLNDQGIDPKDVKPFENKVDLTAVYDKTGSSPISPLYTDSDTKRKLQEITGNTFNTDLFGDTKKPEENNLSVDETLDPSPIDANTTPKDLSLLKSDLNQEGINVRPYYRAVKEPVSSKTFIETNKIKMVRNWIVFFIQALLLGLTYLITSKLNLLDGTVLGTYIYFIVGAGVMLLIAFISTIKFWINPYKKVTAKYAPRISHLFALLFTVQFYVIIYCINLQFGFYSFTQTDYNHLNWIIPCVICLSPIIGSIVYQILYRSKNFHI